MSRSLRIGGTRRSEPIGTADDGIGGFDRLFREEAPKLARFFRRGGTHRDDVPDLVQESFVRLVGATPSDSIRAPQAYLQRIARNLLFDRSKRLSHRLAGMHMPYEEQSVPALAPEQTLAIEARQTLMAYERALEGLTARTREVFTLHREQERSYKEISAQLGISVGTVEYHIARALVHIADALDLTCPSRTI